MNFRGIETVGTDCEVVRKRGSLFVGDVDAYVCKTDGAGIRCRAVVVEGLYTNAMLRLSEIVA